MMKRVIIKVVGQVQGVLFRHTARVRASELNLNGWIRNENDGSVAIVAEGEENDLKKLVAWSAIGPPLAKVARVEVKWQEATGEFKQFEII